MKKKGWHDKARDLFYNEKLTIVDIEKGLGVTQKTISVFLQTENPDAYKAERDRRKKDTEERTKEIKKSYVDENPEKVHQSQISYRAKQLGMTPEAYLIYLFQRPSLKDELRQQHENDVMEMSAHGMPKTISPREFQYYGSGYRQTRSGRYVRLDTTKGGTAVPATLPKRI